MVAAGKSSKKKRINKGNLNSFVLFLFLASLFWLLTKFSKEYASDVTTTISFLNIPDETIVQGDVKQEVNLNLEASGFEFMFYKLKMPKVVIDLSKINPDNNNTWTISKTDLEDLASKSFKHPVTAKIPESGLILGLDALGKLTVPVKSTLSFSMQKGYAMVDSLVFTPDSVTYIGPKNQLKGLTAAFTKTKSFDDVNKDLTGTIEVNIPDNTKNVKVVPENVSYSLSVAEFVEAELLIPVTMVNAPAGSNIQLFPSSIKVRYTINFENYSSVTAADFKIVCDFASILEDSNIVIPQLVQQPPMAKQVTLEKSQVEFIFIQ